MKYFYAVFLGLLMPIANILAQSTNANTVSAPKREMRGVWISTVWNLDYPSRAGLSSDEQRKEFIELLDFHKKNGINAVFVQVRPNADALYQSDFEPWSHWLTGVQGKAPSPEYDPLDFMIEEAHKRFMEFHAWFNPFRVLSDTTNNYTSSDHISRRRPDLFVKYGKGLYFDPGIPENRAYITKIVQDVVNRYDVDGVHFDDYFYPYPISGVDFPDNDSFKKYGRGFDSTKRADWRRQNVNQIIQMLRDSIRVTKFYVKFGIGPFGIWRNKAADAAGSATNGLANYDQLYADIRLWLGRGWIDYCAPQLYWQIGHKAADYATLVDWWSKNSSGKHLYIGHSAYQIGDKNSPLEWQNPSEMPNQIRINRKNSNVQGSIFFSARSFKNNPLGINDTLQNNFYRYPALIPAMPWIDGIAPVAPYNIRNRRVGEVQMLSWDVIESDDELIKPKYYVVYRFKGKTVGDTNNPANIYAITQDKFVMLKRAGIFSPRYTFVVTALDRLHNESTPSVLQHVRLKE